MAGQSKRHSLFESISNVVVGFTISVAANWIVLPWFGYNVTVKDSAGIGLVLTIVSVVRSYILRRVYNWWYVISNERLRRTRGDVYYRFSTDKTTLSTRLDERD